MEQEDLEMYCELKFGNEVNSQVSEFFVKDNPDTEVEGDDSTLNNFQSVWQGRLDQSFFRFEMELDDEGI